MKKIFLFTVLCLVGGTAFAQKKNVSRANNELKQEKPNYEEARLLLKEARENPETQNDAKTWRVSAEVEDAIFLQNDQKRITNQSHEDAAMYKALEDEYAYSCNDRGYKQCDNGGKFYEYKDSCNDRNEEKPGL